MFAITGKFLLINICVFKNIQTHTHICFNKKRLYFSCVFLNFPFDPFPRSFIQG